ncbi:hypothetical protein DOTSEDRAFT_69328 [Dothistroma septosporum NZE10]|uniref:Zn(2)-C6 fungal-type domain-containing protein n=1 Tax=Dothistroma septosporum (strain NZE10 / CBS 128990) TaxID=675120 RepID=N1PY72_DOTSN|nr:hypothetical protein DOTSEDRAFT_69328 [Dothistroma septosporum NZE10]
MQNATYARASWSSGDAIRHGIHRSTRRRSTHSQDAQSPIMPVSRQRSAITSSSSQTKIMRKRAARACDQCRRRKSRCDGHAECSACKVVGLQCSYGHTIKQSRGPSYVAHLEKKVNDLEQQVKTGPVAVVAEEGNESVSSAKHSAGMEGPSHSSPTFSDRPSIDSVPTVPSLVSDMHSYSSTSSFLGPTAARYSSRLTTITMEPRGKPYGIDILRQQWNYCNRITSPPISDRPESSLKVVQALDSTLSVDSIAVNVNGHPLLPIKIDLMHWIEVASSEAFHLWPFVDRRHIDGIVFRLYNTNAFGQDENDHDDLALIYSLLALGMRFDMAGSTTADARRMQGLAYFAAARDMVPLPYCDRSLPALQTILCMALYLKAGAALTRTHAYVSAAASGALRMGLHETIPGLPADEQTTRQRVRSTIHMLDVYISSSLGIPRIISTQEQDVAPFPQWLTTVVEEELVPCIAASQLFGMMSRAIDSTYRHPSASKAVDGGGYAINELNLAKACDDLEAWTQNSPALAVPVENMSRSQLLLSYLHAWAHLTLLSPFVHHLHNTQSRPEKTHREAAYAHRAVQAALHAVQVAETLHSRLLLHEAYFSTIDVLVQAAMVLLVVELGSSNSTLLSESIEYGRRAKELLLTLSLQNPAAKECWEALSPVHQAVKNIGQPYTQTNAKRPPTLVASRSVDSESMSIALR